MDNVNKTLYIPLYGKAFVSRKGCILTDKKAEEIWAAEGFVLKGKSASKWLAYYMGIRAAVFDDWTRRQVDAAEDAVVLHIGCGLDSRVLRVHTNGCMWYDVDFAEVIQERCKYYQDTQQYKMLAGDVRDSSWLQKIPHGKQAIVVMEGVSMYLSPAELQAWLADLDAKFEQVAVLMDCYTPLAAKLSKYRNPVKDVGVHTVYGIEDPAMIGSKRLRFYQEHEMTPQCYIDALSGMEKRLFKKLYAGNFSKKLYKLFEYQKGNHGISV